MTNRDPVIIDAATGEIETLPPTKGQRYRCKLDTLADIKREVGKVYREARSGMVEVQDATKLTWILQALSKIVESGDLERRVEQLENK